MSIRIKLFCHSIVSDWNHGNAHFLRGILTEFASRGYEVESLEPEDSWSRCNLVDSQGPEVIEEFHSRYPDICWRTYNLDRESVEDLIGNAEIVIVHEWNPPELIAAIGAYRRRNRNVRAFFHDTHHRAITARHEMRLNDLADYDGILVYGQALREAYHDMGWTDQVHVWHEAADTRVFKPLSKDPERKGLVWIGNWGDDERTRELEEFLIHPVEQLQIPAKIYGVRYPGEALERLHKAGIEYGDWLPNYRAPEVFSKAQVTVHVPRRPYVSALAGIPTIRPFEAMACCVPLICSPWEDVEGLFRKGEDYLAAKDGAEMKHLLAEIIRDERLAASLAQNGLATIQRRHTCGHRVDEFLRIYEQVAPPVARLDDSAKHEVGDMRIAFFGSSILSSYWNGAATYYRGLLRGLAYLGYQITFYEPDAYGRQQHRDVEELPWVRSVVYAGDDPGAVELCLEDAQRADIVVKASGVGVFDELLERRIAGLHDDQTTIFWDVDAPATLDRVLSDKSDAFHEAIGRYDVIFTYGGGERVVDTYRLLGARACIPVYNAVDADTHFPVSADPDLTCCLAFQGNRLPDREARVDEFFFRPANYVPEQTFVLGGSGWGDKAKPANVRYIGHVGTQLHNAFNSSSKFVLNINRDSMASYGFSPPTRVFEAAASAACLISDAWAGIEMFLEPGREILIAKDGPQIAEMIRTISDERAREIGEAARKRVLAEHTYTHRALQVDAVLRDLTKEREQAQKVFA